MLIKKIIILAKKRKTTAFWHNHCMDSRHLTNRGFRDFRDFLLSQCPYYNYSHMKSS